MRSLIRSVLLLAGMMLALLPSGVAAAGMGQDATPTPAATLTPAPVTPVPHVSETDNYLVLGVDQRPGWKNWRSDTIMVVAVHHETQQVGIISIPRDLWVNIPGYGMGRINQADYLGESRNYPGGGPALISAVLEENLGLRTEHWVRVKQEGLTELVDALGGVTITLDCPLRELTPHPTIPGRYVRFELPAGETTLDGATAKKFATFRYASSDFARARRQQQLIWAIRDRALQVNAIPLIPQLWGALSNTFETDLTLLDVVRLAHLGTQLQAEQVRGLTFSPRALKDTTLSGGAQVLTIRDQQALLNEVDSLFTGKPIAEQGREGSGRCTPAQGTR